LKGESYVSLNYSPEEIRVKAAVQAQGFGGTVILSNVIETQPFKIDRSGSVLTRIAGSMKRAGKAEFEGRLPVDEKVIVCFENASFFLKSPGGQVMFKSPTQFVQAVPVQESASAVALTARHGDSTELKFVGKKSLGGMKFTPEQTRDLFLETLALFAAPKKASPSKK
jgi:hypothetical protein